ncbi:FCD domain-containing protein [Pseudooceanicola sp. CBS1P-1]|uniref:FCD domain-containing protein n=1 Tax=Pseudooceanicola TaxID=1679449 RepID=UPI001369A604|nr:MULTISPECIES: FCD domain-containing protein [Pseudooceanicola]MBT9382654.1 FCD domain-containing protein [Pseudooceanicola endophyticus]
MSIPSFNAAPRKSLVSHVETQIRDALIEGRMAPGTRLVTKDLASSLDVSITPAREALVRFVASGVLSAEPAASFRVPSFDAAGYRELSVIRKRVEGLAAEMASENITDADIASLDNQLASLERACAGADMHIALKANHEFRFAFYAFAKMPTLLDVIDTLWLRAGPGHNMLFIEAGQTFDPAPYRTLIEALRRHDADGARAIIEDVIDALSDAVVARLRAEDSRTA